MTQQTQQTERTEIRPHMRLGLILVGVGIFNALTGASSLGLRAADLDGAALMWADKLIFMAMIAYGIWISRKKIILENGTMLLAGLVPGRRSAEVLIADIESVAYDASKRGVEIKAKGGTLLVRLGPGSKAVADLYRALRARGVTVPDQGNG